MSFSRIRVSSSQLDFIVIDMREDVEVPLILGCPFLATTKTVVDVEEEKLTLRLGMRESFRDFLIPCFIL